MYKYGAENRPAFTNFGGLLKQRIGSIVNSFSKYKLKYVIDRDRKWTKPLLSKLALFMENNQLANKSYIVFD